MMHDFPNSLPDSHGPQAPETPEMAEAKAQARAQVVSTMSAASTLIERIPLAAWPAIEVEHGDPAEPKQRVGVIVIPNQDGSNPLVITAPTEDIGRKVKSRDPWNIRGKNFEVMHSQSGGFVMNGCDPTDSPYVEEWAEADRGIRDALREGFEVAPLNQSDTE